MAKSTTLQRVSLEQALAKCSVLSPSYLQLGRIALDQTVQEIDVHSLHRGYLKGFGSRGGETRRNTRVISMNRGPNTWLVQSQIESFECQYVINAAGAWADHIATLAGKQPVGLVPFSRTVIKFDVPSVQGAADWPFVVDIHEEFYFKPESGGILASPGDERTATPGDAQAEELGVALTVDRIERATTMQISKILSKWAGLRTFAPDRAPVVGWDTEDSTFFWLAGQGGSGIMTAPALAMLSASYLIAGSLPLSDAVKSRIWSSISPERFNRAIKEPGQIFQDAERSPVTPAATRQLS